MDANDFTSLHVVSGDDADNANALPAVLSAARRGEFDEDVFSGVGAAKKVLPTIVALLDGTRQSNDPQGEAYGLLLRAYCDYWHRYLPFMFDDAGAADEILMPADLLASDSMLRKAVEVMTVADCVGDEGRGNVEIIGWLYQFYIAERKDEVMAGFKKSKKAGAAEIPAATQLFTPDWIVQYLVQNTVGRLWTQSHPESQLWKNWAYYIPATSAGTASAEGNPATSAGTASAEGNPVKTANTASAERNPAPSAGTTSAPSVEGAPGEAGWGSVTPPLAGAVTRSVTGGGHNDQPEGTLNITTPEELTVCDPACGSGHMLTYAFDLLYDIYDEAGYSANEIPGLILQHNLFGLEIDERAANLAAFALTMKARGRYRRFFRKGRQVQPNIQRITPEQFSDTDIDNLNELYHVNLDADTWNTYEHANVYGSLIQPPKELTSLLPLAEADEHSESEGGQPMLLAPDLEERSHTVLTQTRYLARKYAAVVANPPYMGSSNMGADLKKYVTDHYKDGKSDLFAAFILRNLQLIRPNALLGMITMQSWMFLSSFENLRKSLLTKDSIETMAHLGAGAFDSIGGEVVSTTAFTIRNGRSNGKGTYLRLVDVQGDDNQAHMCATLLRSRWRELSGLGETEGGQSGDTTTLSLADARQLPPAGAKELTFTVDQQDFAQIPGSPIVYWLSDAMRKTFTMGKPLEEVAKPRVGLQTGSNERFIREWWEVAQSRSSFDCASHEEAATNGRRWFPHLNGGDFRKWYGNQELIINWENDGQELYDLRPRSVIRNPQYYFHPSFFWSRISSGQAAFRMAPKGFLFSDTAPSIFAVEKKLQNMIALCNSSTAMAMLHAIAPTLHFEVGQIARLPFLQIGTMDEDVVRYLVSVSKVDWDSYETSWDFAGLEVLGAGTDHPQSASLTAPASGGQNVPLSERVPAYIERCKRIAEEQRQREIRNNELVADAYGVRDEVPCDVPIERVSLKRNPAFAYPKNTPAERDELMTRDIVKEIISYAVGCMFGRYSLDKPGLILASQGETLDDYHTQVPNPSFEPDADNVIPITDDEWFEDDIVTRFRRFLAVACGEEYLNANIAYIEQVLGKPLRKYFANDFYDDHVRMYKNRPIYWMYSSRTDNKGAFKALVYLHRYTPATTNNVLKYLREFAGKLNAQSEALMSSAKPSEVRKGEKLRTVIKECADYERDVLYPLATRNLPIDLDDGVLVNYLRMGKAVRTIKPIEAKRTTVQTWTWPTNPLEV
nr:BREX-1 system adenine-specific DNA-methyltransferase PglX [Bifidobacterium leontopitheci]